MSGTIDLTNPQQMNAFVSALKQAGIGGSGGSPKSPSNPNSGTMSGFKPAAFGGALGDLTGSISRAGGSLTQLTGDLTKVGGAIPVFGKAAKMFGGSVGTMVQYIENSNESFRTLSKVGGGFNGDLGALRMAAANTRMPLDAFTQVIASNSTALAGLGAGVNKGSQRFSQLSRAMFEDGRTIEGMTSLGYSLEEANEYLLQNADLMSRQIVSGNMSDKQVAAATLAMAENMAFIAEVTGESAEQQKQELLDANRDGKNIAAMRLAEISGAKDVQTAFNNAFQGLNVVGDQGQALLKDYLQQDAPLSKMTTNFESMNPKIAATIREMATLAKTSNSVISAEDKTIRMAQLRAKVEQQTAASMNDRNKLFVATTGQLSSVGDSMAQFYGNTDAFQKAVTAQQTEMRKSLGREVSRQEATAELEKQTRARISTQGEGGTPGQELMNKVNESTIALANSANKVHVAIASNLGANTTLVETIGKGLDALTGVAGAVNTAGAEAVKIAPGTPTQQSVNENNYTPLFNDLGSNNMQDPTQSSNGGLTAKMLDNLKKALGNTKANDDSTTTLFDDFLKKLEDVGVTIPGRAQGGPVSSNTMYKVGEEGPEYVIPKFDGTVMPAQLTALIDDTFGKNSKPANANITKMFKELEGTIIPNVTQSISRVASNITASQSNQSQTPTTVEDVSQSGYGIDTRKMEQSLDNLNQSMLQLIQINNNVSRNSAKQRQAIQGAGDLMRGVTAR